jgi:L-alanine-DL-glutamate epimerase-like enolase superfamily enzyme
MKITEMHLYRGPSLMLIELVSDEGLAGYGEGSPMSPSLNAMCQQLSRQVIGMDPFCMEKNLETLLLGNNNYKFAGQMLAICTSAVEIAMWDLMGKALEQPVYQLLGGRYRERVPVYASALKRTRTPAEEAAFLAEWVERCGFEAVKIKVGERFGYDRDAARGRTEKLVRQVRSTLGDAIDILADANSGYSDHGAIRIGRALEQARVVHFEEPCPFWDLDANARVAAALDLPIAGGEQDWDIFTYRDMLKRDVYDIIQFDVAKCGGLLKAKKISSMTGAFGRAVTPHCVNHSLILAASLHLAASTPELRYRLEYAVDGDFPSAGMVKGFKTAVENGCLNPPEAPGLGVEIDRDFLAAQAERIF